MVHTDVKTAAHTHTHRHTHTHTLVAGGGLMMMLMLTVSKWDIFMSKMRKILVGPKVLRYAQGPEIM